MKELVRTKMLNDYSKLTYKKETVCVKYRYEYKDVMVNLYFDAFDPKSYTLTMIMNTEKQFYFTTLNIMNTRIRKEYLPKLSPVFLNKILVANELDDFYEHMEERILTIEPVIANYKKDKINLILDTDTYNECDDQFALSYLIKSKMSFWDGLCIGSGFDFK